MLCTRCCTSFFYSRYAPPPPHPTSTPDQPTITTAPVESETLIMNLQNATPWHQPEDISEPI